MPQQLSTNTFTSSTWIVNSDATKGTHTTLGAALTSATSGDTILLQTSVTENVTLKAGVNITGYAGADLTPNVSITGKLSLALVGVVTISNIDLITNSDNFLSVGGSAVSIVNLRNCYLNCLNNTGISYTTSNAASQINLYNCTGNLGTTGIGLFTATSTGALNIFTLYFTNTGSSLTASTTSACSVSMYNCFFVSFLSCTSSGTFFLYQTTVGSPSGFTALNTTALTTAGTGVSDCNFSYLISGTASAASIGTGTTLGCYNTILFSTNTNAVTGAGTLISNNVSYSSSSHLSNVTTQTGGAAWGLTQGTAPSAGCIGEQIRAVNSTGAASGGTGNIVNITSISLTAGIWDISTVCQVNFNGLNTSVTAGISGTSTTFSLVSTDAHATIGYASSLVTSQVICIPSYRVTLSATTPYYLNFQASFSTNNCSGYGRISATRVG